MVGSTWLNWAGVGCSWVELNTVEPEGGRLDWVSLCWAGLEGAGLGWTIAGFDWAELD